MNCAFCGKEIDDDVKVCPFCRKYIARNVSGVNLEKPAAETAAEPAAMPAAETAPYAEEKLCPCCQTPVKPESRQMYTCQSLNPGMIIASNLASCHHNNQVFGGITCLFWWFL